MTPTLNILREKIQSVNLVEWVPFSQYNNKAIVTYKGVIYISTCNENIGSNPITGTNWLQLI